MKSLTTKQYAIIAHVKAFGMITKKNANDLLKSYYVDNHSKYVSAVLRSLVVTHKLLEHQGRGVYIMRKAFLADDPDQLALFNPYEEPQEIGRVPHGENVSDLNDK